MIESVKRFAMTPEVVEATARVARQRLNEELSRQREELKSVNVRVRNAKSQLVHAKNIDPDREAALKEIVSSGEASAERLRTAVARGEKLRFDDQMVRQRLATFDDAWKVMTIEQQAALLRTLIERVGYDSLGDKVRVTYNSNGIREFCKGAMR